MSATADNSGPTPYITVAGSQLPLPPSARLDLAYTWVYTFPDQHSNPSAITQQVPGTYMEIVQAASFSYQTSSATGTRLMGVSLAGPTYTLAEIFPATGLAPNTSALFQWIIGLSTFAGTAATAGIYAPLPPIIVPPGGSWAIGPRFAIGSSDVATGYTVTTLRIPSGPNASRVTFTPTLQLT